MFLMTDHCNHKQFECSEINTNVSITIDSKRALKYAKNAQLAMWFQSSIRFIRTGNSVTAIFHFTFCLKDVTKCRIKSVQIEYRVLLIY